MSLDAGERLRVEHLGSELEAGLAAARAGGGAHSAGAVPTGLSPERIEAALRAAGGVVSHAAARLGCGRKTLYRHMERLGIDPDSFRSG